MKKLIVIFFLYSFCLNQIGHFVFYYLQKWHIQEMVKREILAGVPDQYLEIIEYNKNIEWEEEGKEFSLGNEFYDIVRTKIINGKTMLYCLNDKNEEELLINFAKNIKSTTDNEKKNNNQSIKFQLLDQQLINITSDSPVEVHNPRKYFLFVASLVTNIKEIVSPPPRFMQL